MAVSKNFGEYTSRIKDMRGWFTSRLDQFTDFLNQAFVNMEGGLKRNSIFYAMTGDDLGTDQYVQVDAVADHFAEVAGYQMNYGLGSWLFNSSGGVNSVRLWALGGLTAREYTLALVANSGPTWAFTLVGNVLTILVPSDNSGTVSNLKAALGAHATMGGNIAVDSAANDAWGITTAHVEAAQDITAPANWGTGITVMSVLQELVIYELSSTAMTLLLLADVFSTSLDNVMPCTLEFEIWQDGYLHKVSHGARLASAE